MRYLKVTLIYGFLTCLVVAALGETGAFYHLDRILWTFLGRASSPSVFRSVPQYTLFILMAFGITWTTIDINKRLLKVVIAVGALLQILSLTWVLNLYDVFFSPFAAISAIVISFCFGLAYSQSEAGQRKRIARSIFGERLSRRTFSSVVNSNDPLNFGGEIREATVVVCEIFNHSDLMDVLPVADYVATTNMFLRNGADFLVEIGGYLDECDGESLRVVFGAPLKDKHHAARACKAALELVRRIEDLNRECESTWQQKLSFGIGINSGEMVTAAYGSRHLSAFSAAGESVEFARRLCAANRIYGSRILMGAGTFELAANAIESRPIELIRNRKARSHDEFYELLAMKDTLSEGDLEKRDLYWKAVICYREQRWDEALEYFEKARSETYGDGPLEFYIRKIEGHRAGAPALDWDNARI